MSKIDSIDSIDSMIKNKKPRLLKREDFFRSKKQFQNTNNDTNILKIRDQYPPDKIAIIKKLTHEYLPQDPEEFGKFGAIPAGTEILVDGNNKILSIPEQTLPKLNILQPVKNLRFALGGYFKIYRGRKYGLHNGLDYACPAWTPIKAPISGIIEKIGHDPLSGYFIRVNHGGGLYSVYCHLSPFYRKSKIGKQILFVRYLPNQDKFRIVLGKKKYKLSYQEIQENDKLSTALKKKVCQLIARMLPVKKGETIKKGQLFTYSGNTGLSSGAHLHLNFYFKGELTNVYGKYLWNLCRERELYIHKHIGIWDKGEQIGEENRTYLDPYLTINPDYNWKGIEAKYIAIKKARRHRRAVYLAKKRRARNRRRYASNSRDRYWKAVTRLGFMGKPIKIVKKYWFICQNKLYKVNIRGKAIYRKRVV